MTTPSAKGFGLGEFHQASLAAKSLMAQFEYLCIKYKSTCLKKIGVSYTKLLLVPFAILKFGWTDELSIDCRMKGIWSKVGAAGGAGCAPEEYSIRGYLRTVALLKVRMALMDEKRRATVFIAPAISNKFELHQQATAQSAAKDTYISVLKYMYAGNVGAAVAEAFDKGVTADWKEATIKQVHGIDLRQLQYFSRLATSRDDPSKFFRTYPADMKLLNCRGIPRSGSNIFVTGLDAMDAFLMRMMVLFAVQVRVSRGNNVFDAVYVPMVAGYRFTEISSEEGYKTYSNPARDPVMFVLSGGICLHRVTTGFRLKPSSDETYNFPLMAAYTNPYELVAIPTECAIPEFDSAFDYELAAQRASVSNVT